MESKAAVQQLSYMDEHGKFAKHSRTNNYSLRNFETSILNLNRTTSLKRSFNCRYYFHWHNNLKANYCFFT